MVESDPCTPQETALLLTAAGLIVDQSETGEEALELARHNDYEIIVLGPLLTGIDVFDLLDRLRRARIETPVLVLSQISEAAARVKAFRLGADDFVVKPFDKAELLARIRAVIRRRRRCFSQAILRVGPLQINLETQAAAVAGREIHLTSKEFAMLELLMQRKNTVIPKESFLNHLYCGRNEPEAKIIDVFICKVRRKLADTGVKNLIETVWGRGYILRDQTGLSVRPATL